MRRLVMVPLAVGLLLAGCGTGDTAGTEPGAQQRVPVTVLAAASLTDVFTAMEPRFEAANPTADLRFSFGASSDLATQIVNGAPADVFASANERQMKVVTDAGRAAGTPEPFTTNVLTIVVPPGNPKGIRSFADLAGPDVTELVCAPQVPCGAATEQIEKATNITLSPASEEPDVRSVLAKIEAKEADAGLVYITDARSAEGKIEQINFPEARDAVNVYPIVAIEGAEQAQLAEAFVAFVLGPEGQRELTAAGFTPRFLTQTRDPHTVRIGLPGALWVPAVAALGLIVLPVIGLVVRAPWPRFVELISSESALAALELSLRTAAVSTLLCVVLGGPLAVVLARGSVPSLRLLRSVVLLPLVLPPVVGGLALLYLLGVSGFAGYALDVAFGLRLPFTTAAVILAQTFVAMPFLVVSLEGALRTGGERYEVIAASLGARPWTVFRRITVPLVLPGLGSGMVLSFARCLGEFGATIAFAGSLQGVTRTLPLEVYLQREVDADAAIALSLVLVVVAILVIAVARPRSTEGLQ